jgi:signal transduction histidine kinase/phage shock protein PspC (stress-responsive transcriptional regulator)
MVRASGLCDDCSTMTSTAPPYPFRRATRDTSDTYLGGVASGLARHLDVPVMWVRVAFILGAVAGGVGIAMYAGLWLLLPSDDRFDPSAPGLAAATRTGKRPRPQRRLADVGPAIALAALCVGIVLMVQIVFGRGALFWPVALGIVGVALIWRQADEAQRERWVDTSGRIHPVRALVGSGGWASYTRLVAGGALIIAGLAVFAATSGRVDVAKDVLVAGLLGIVGLALTVGPWVFRLAADLGDERAERVRSQERADVAAHLHDPVLQTLALIQKNSGDAATVARLARAQERDLRQWLFADEDAQSGSLSWALQGIAGEVEAEHTVAVEVVTVGDADVDEALRPLVLATREAVSNAARHAGVGQVDVYAEVSPAAVEVFVKDRGAGFDLAQVPGDRQGVRGSIVDRMERHGGSAVVKSTPGVGTEVVLRMPLEEGR